MTTGSIAAPSKGVLHVESDPGGAEIYLTNTSVSEDTLSMSDTAGITPREFFVNPGEYRLFLKKYGYITWWNASFTVTPASYQSFHVNLTQNEKQYGAIHTDSKPSGANLVPQHVIPDITSSVYSNTTASIPEGEIVLM